MMAALRQAWDRAWFAPVMPRSLTAARVIVCLDALWIVLSNPMLPSVVGWPNAFWTRMPRTLLIRFGYVGLHEALEWTLFVLLIAALLAATFGFAIRLTALAAALLLYHFAPLDAMLSYGDLIGMGGLTVPLIFLLALWAARRDERWPITLAQLFLALSFLLSGIMKVRLAGPAWYSGATLQQMALTYWSLSGRSAALRVALNPAAAWAIGMGSAALDLSFVFAVFFRRLRWFVVPLAIAALVVRSAVFGLHWLAAPLLLLFIVDCWPCAGSPESSSAKA